MFRLKDKNTNEHRETYQSIKAKAKDQLINGLYRCTYMFIFVYRIVDMIICVLYFFIKECPITFLEKRNCDYGNIEQYSNLGYKTNISKR